MEALQLISDNTTEYKGYIHIAYKNSSGEFFELCSRQIDNFAEFGGKFRIIKSYDYYITANSTKTAKERNNESVFALNNIVIDIDCHKKMSNEERNRLLDKFIFYFMSENDSVPCPNIIHKTGRGIQLWWHLEQASVKLAFIYRKCVEMLIKSIEWLQEEIPDLKQLEVDKTASCNICGYFRMFDTYNSNTHTKTETEILHTRSFNLIDMFDQLNDSDIIEEQMRKCEEQKKSENKKNIIHFDCSYISLQKKRIDMLEWLVQARQGDLEGSREILCFLHYNACIQLYNSLVAQLLTKNFNKQFSSPLPEKEIEHIFKCLSKKYYKFKNKTFFEWLGLTEEEIKNFEEQRDARNATRNAKLKKRKSDKQSLEQIAVDMIKSGKYKYADIAETTKFSLSKVKRLASSVEKPLSAEKEKPWEKQGISRAAYYKRKRKNAEEKATESTKVIEDTEENDTSNGSIETKSSTHYVITKSFECVSEVLRIGEEAESPIERKVRAP